MSLLTEKKLALALASLVVREGDEMLCVGGDEEAEKLIKTKPESQACVVWLSGTLAPVWRFWQLREAGFMKPDAYVIFTGIKDCTDWNDLVKIYGGSRFGSLFIMKMGPSTRPGICPSQRGMYFK